MNLIGYKVKESTVLEGINIEDKISKNSDITIYTKEDAQEVFQKAFECAKDAYQTQIFPTPTLPHVPELMAYLDTVPYFLFEYLKSSLPNEFRAFEVLIVPSLLKRNFCTGIVAVQLWHVKWDKLKVLDLIEMIIENTPIEELDKYVIKITYGLDSKAEVDKLNAKVKAIFPHIVAKFGVLGLDGSEVSKSQSDLQLIKMSQVAYLLGCAYRLHELGMH